MDGKCSNKYKLFKTIIVTPCISTKLGEKDSLLLFFNPKGLSLQFPPLSFSFSAFLSGCWRRIGLFKLLACMGRCCRLPALSGTGSWPPPAGEIPHSLSSWCIQPLLVQNEVRSHLLPLWLWFEPRLGCSMGHLPESARSCLPQGDCWYPSLPRVIWKWSWGGMEPQPLALWASRPTDFCPKKVTSGRDLPCSFTNFPRKGTGMEEKFKLKRRQAKTQTSRLACLGFNSTIV